MNKKWLSTTFVVKGLNCERILSSLKKRQISMYDIKKTDAKTLYFRVKFTDSKKVFAINKDLCYNIKKVRESGLLYPFYYLFTNVGLLIGLCLFVFATVFCNDYILDIKYSGSGGVYKKQVAEYLDSRGITTFTRFSDTDLKELSNDILSTNSHFSFVNCSKSGNILQINLAVAKDKNNVISGQAKSLISDVDGVVEKIKVYRGTSLKAVGEPVTAGEEIVSGIVTIKEQTLEIGVIAQVCILSNFNYQYYSENDNEEEMAVMFAENLLGQEVISSDVQKSQINGKYIYEVRLVYRRVIYAG